MKPHEVKAVALSFLYFFFLLTSYYILRPLRDEMGVAGGVHNLPWLFTSSFLALLLAAPLLAFIVNRYSRAKFIPLIYQFFVLNLLLFWTLLELGIATHAVVRILFVWITVYSVFSVSVFWSFMSDLYSSEQSKRLFAFIAAGGSLGMLLGPFLTHQLAEPLGPVNLLWVSAALLESALVCAWGLEKVAPKLHAATAHEFVHTAEDISRGPGNVLHGFHLLLRSRYLSGIALWVFLLSLAGTFLYMQQAHLVAAASDNPAARTRIFARIDLTVGAATILIQFLATGRLISRFGVGVAAAVLPLVFMLGFMVLAIHPALIVVVAFQALQRSTNFGIANPAREAFFTVLSRNEKFKAKNIIDGAAFHGADAFNAWLFVALASMVTLPVLSLVGAGAALGWLMLSLGLGRAHERRVAGNERWRLRRIQTSRSKQMTLEEKSC